jgi:hypothetical protein
MFIHYFNAQYSRPLADSALTIFIKKAKFIKGERRLTVIQITSFMMDIDESLSKGRNVWFFAENGSFRFTFDLFHFKNVYISLKFHIRIGFTS